MRLIGVDTEIKGLKCDRDFSSVEDWVPCAEEHVLVLHFNGVKESFLNAYLGKRANLGGILFVKSGAFAGETKGSAERLTGLYQGRAHFLSYSLPNLDLRGGEVLQAEIQKRFDIFRGEVHKLRLGDKIPWHLVEPPPWPEELVALYLALVAAKRSPGLNVEVLSGACLREAKQSADELWKTYGAPATPQPDLNESSVGANLANLDKLRALFEEIAKK